MHQSRSRHGGAGMSWQSEDKGGKFASIFFKLGRALEFVLLGSMFQLEQPMGIP